MIDIERVQAIDWQYLACRRESMFQRGTVMDCYPICAEVTGIDWRPKADLRVGPDIYLLREDMQALRDTLLKGGVPGLKAFRDRLVERTEACDVFMKRWEANHPACETKEEMERCWHQFFTALRLVTPFLIPMPIADGVLSQSILERLPEGTEEEKQNWLKILAYPVKDNEHTKEERAFYQLVRCYMDSDSTIESLIAEHARRFGWIGSRGAWWKFAWTADDVRERLEQFVAQGKNPEHEVQALERSRRERQESCEQLYRDWNLQPGSELYEWVQLAKEYAYLRTWRTDVWYGSTYRAGFLLEKIAQTVGWSLDDVCFLSPPEMRRILETGQAPFSRDELDRRAEFFGMLLLDDALTIFSGKQGEEEMYTFFPRPVKDDAKEVKGSIAFQGKVTGRVKIVFTSDDLKHVERGDVLVATMTFPHFIAAMEKACAFVTDEGGILCHAAIVSREMRKPCVIATKKATKVFKDGDVVEVDAEKGVVRKIQ